MFATYLKQLGPRALAESVEAKPGLTTINSERIVPLLPLSTRYVRLYAKGGASNFALKIPASLPDGVNCSLVVSSKRLRRMDNGPASGSARVSIDASSHMGDYALLVISNDGTSRAVASLDLEIAVS